MGGFVTVEREKGGFGLVEGKQNKCREEEERGREKSGRNEEG